jgi:predicted nucleotidyltransferase
MDWMIEERRGDLADVCARHGVRRLEVFGSAVTGRFDPMHSDLDFLVQFDTAPPVVMADRYFGLLEDLQILFGLPVDLVMESAIRNPFFRRAVDESRQLLYAA